MEYVTQNEILEALAILRSNSSIHVFVLLSN